MWRRGLSEDFFREAARWIRCNTVTTRSNLPFLSHLISRFRPLGGIPRLQTVRRDGESFGNLLVRWGPAGEAPLLCNTHSDTVPPGPWARWTATGGRPWTLARRGADLFGLGVADVKLNLLCQWEALRRLQPLSFRRPLILAATFGEERGLLGARRLIATWRGPKPRLVLVGEPSEGRLIHRHRSYLVFLWSLPLDRIRVGALLPRARGETLGRSAHSSTPEWGDNALEKSLNAMYTEKRKRGRFLLSHWEGGTAPNQVPAEARWEGRGAAPGGRLVSSWPWETVAETLPRLKAMVPRGGTFNWGQVKVEEGRLVVIFDVRCPPEVPVDRVQREMGRVLDAVPGSRWRVAVEDPGLNARRTVPALRGVQNALRAAGWPVLWEEKKTCTEAGLYDAWGVPAVVWGPGRSTGNVHRPNERMPVAHLARAVDFYETLFRWWAQG